MSLITGKSIRWKLLVLITGLLLAMSAALTTFHIHEELRLLNNSDGSGKVEHDMNNQIMTSICVSALVLMAGMLITLNLSNRLINPIVQLTENVEHFASGRFNTIEGMRPDGEDEVGKLSRAFIKMAERIQASQAELKSNIEEAKRSEEKLSLFFNQSTDMLGIADFDTKIIQVNQAFVKTLGYERSDVEGRSYLELVHPDDLNKSMAAVNEMKEGHNLVEFENRFRCADGTYRLINWNVASHVELSCIYAIGRDITEQRRMEEEVITTTEQTQERIARDLHDGLGQTMTGLAYKAKLMEGMLKEGAMPESRQAAEIVQLANQAGIQARSLARGLDPVELQQGLPLALEFLAHTTREMFSVACSTQYDDIGPIEKSAASHLYRIAQEAVNNAIRHSHPTHISFFLTRESDEISLVVLNDGAHQVIEPSSGNGRGIRFMKYRAKIIGGKLSILPAPNGGTMVKCSIPAKADA